jgi:hypothetical protein
MRRTLASAAVALTILFAVAAAIAAPAEEGPTGALVIGSWLTLVALIGALVTMRVAGNPIGALLLVIASVGNLWSFAGAYAQSGYTPSGPLGWEAALWGSQWLVFGGFGLFLFVFLRFPDGRLLSPRWRAVEVAAVTGLVVGALHGAFRPGPTDYVPSVENPLGVTALGPAMAFLEGVGGPLLAFAAIATVLSLVLRFRRSRGAERQQLKWFVFSVAVLPLFLIAGQAIGAVNPDPRDMLGFLTTMLGAFFIPIGMSIAILRYRLYDIDVVINRTLVYGLLTGILAASYLGLVALTQFLLQPLTPQSDLSIVVSTLAVAALFRPLRARLQTFIDRRFYRQRYDAAATLDGFSARLRDQVDLESLRTEIVAVVGTTMQPAHASVWLRSAPRGGQT